MARKWKKVLLVLTAGVAGLLLLVAAFVNTGVGQRSIAGLVEPLSGGRISVEGLSGQIPYSLRAERVQIRDGDGPWLVIEDATVDWSPFALLWNRADIDRFEARHVQVLRLPNEDEEESDTAFAVDVRALRIELLETSAEVSRTPARLTIQGAARYESLDAWSTDLVVNRLDAGGLYRARASLTDGVLTGTADIEEPSAGFLAGLLGLSDVGPIAAHVTGNGPRNANAVALTLSAGPLRAEGRGVIDLVGRTAQLDFSAEAPEMALRPDLVWRSLSAQGQLRGSFDAPDVNANLDFRNLRVRDASADSVTATVTGSAGNLDFNGSVAGLRVPGSDPDVFADAPISIRGTTELRNASRPFTLSMTHPLLSIDALGTAGEVRRAQATITVPRLAPFAERGDVDLDGRATLMATIEEVGNEVRIAANGSVSATSGEGPLPRLIGETARVILSATISGADIAISDARLDASMASARLSGQLGANNIGLNWTLQLADLSVLTNRLVGDLQARGDLRGPWEIARLQANGVANIGTETIAKQQVNVSVNAIGFPRTQNGDFTVEGRFDGAPLAMNGQLMRVPDGLRATVERGTWKTLNARADIIIPEDGRLSGNTNLQLARLEDIASVVGMPIAGDARADIVFRTTDDGISADITARAQAARYADVAMRNIEVTAELTLRDDDRSSARVEARLGEFALPDVAVRNATLSGLVDRPFDNPTPTFALTAPGLTVGQLSGDAKAQIEGPIDALNIRLDWAPRDASGNAGQLGATTRLDLPRQRVLVSALQAKYRDETATLEQPFTLTFGPETTVDRALFRLANGQLTLAGSIAPRLALRATAQNMSPALLAPFVPELSSEGTISATAELSGTIANPEGTISVQGRGLRAPRYSAGLMPASVDARASLRGRSASVNAEIGSGNSLKLSVTGDVSLQGENALSLDVRGQADLSILNAALSAEGRSLQGQMALDLSVRGTARVPQLSGSATLTKGEFQDVQRGVRVREIALTAEGAGEQIRIVALSGRAGDGTITGTGTIDLSKADIPVSFTVSAQNARPLVSDRLTATTDADLRISGAVRGQLVVAGTIDVTQGEITLPESVPPTVVVLDVRRPGATPAQPQQAMGASFADIRYDLTIATRGRVFVRGRGLEAELEGTTTIRGTAAGPQISGGFDLRRGTFTVASRSFVLTSGRVTFDGVSIRNRIDPTLNFAAENTSGGITAKIAITGYASAPRIELSSTPTMPADEILARMLFQRSAAQLTPIQLAQLAETAVSLASGGSGFDPLGSLRRGLGLSRLSVGSAGEDMSGTTVEAGTYVLRNVYIGAKQGLEGGTQAEVQVDLTDRLKAVGTVNAGTNAAITQGSKQRETGSSIGLTYEFEY